MGGAEQPVARRLGEQTAERGQLCERRLGDAAGRAAVLERLPLAAVVCRRGSTEQEQRRAGIARVRRHGEPGALEHSHRADDGRRVDRRAGVLVVERDVARDDRRLEGPAGLGHARDRLAQRVRRRRALGVAEVQAVRDRGRLGAAAGDVEHGLRDGLATAPARVEPHARAVTVEGDGNGALRRRETYDRGVPAGSHDGARADELVVLGVDPGLRADVRAGRAAARAAPRRRRARRWRRARAADRPASRAAPARARSVGASASAATGSSPTISPANCATRRSPSMIVADHRARAARGECTRPAPRRGARARRRRPCAPATPRS